MTKRKAISKKVRFEVFKRDRFTCTYCGKRPPEVMLELEHIVPVADGGADTIDNLTTSCTDCNRGKGRTPLGDVAPHIDELEILASVQEMMERRRDLMAQTHAARATKQAEDNAVALVRSWWRDAFGNVQGVKDVSIRQFVARLSLDRVREAIDATENLADQKPWKGSDDLWRYFCATCWTMIRQEGGER